MTLSQFNQAMERCPIIAAVRQSSWSQALESPAEIIFHLKANITSLPACIRQAHEAKKFIFVNIDLADGLGKDRTAVEFLRDLGVDGIISTRAQVIRFARDAGVLCVQRCFALDSQGTSSISEILDQSPPDLLEIMPGVIGKVIKQFSQSHVPVIAGGLIETKPEVTTALSCGAIAVSTGKPELWYI